MSLPQHVELISFLTDNEDMKQAAKSSLKQGLWAAYKSRNWKNGYTAHHWSISHKLSKHSKQWGSDTDGGWNIKRALST